MVTDFWHFFLTKLLWKSFIQIIWFVRFEIFRKNILALIRSITLQISMQSLIIYVFR